MHEKISYLNSIHCQLLPAWHAKKLVPLICRVVNLVQNVEDVLCRGSGRQKSPSGVQGRSPVRGSDEVPQKLKQFWISICIILTKF